MPHKFHLVSDDEGRKTLTIIVGKNTYTVNQDHEKFDELFALITNYPNAEESSIQELADYETAIRIKFKRLSPRVSVLHGQIVFDNDPVDESIARHIVKCLKNDDKDWVGLVNFLEKVNCNPEKHSRDQLFKWLDRKDFSITTEGDIIAYKGVRDLGNNEYQSTHSGYAIVDGEINESGPVKQTWGNVVEMPRSKVAHDPNAACSTGLHAGTADYAKGFGNKVLTIVINPCDVVSVPNDSAEKIRVNRYKILKSDQNQVYREPIIDLGRVW